jgi:hypothetical protein
MGLFSKKQAGAPAGIPQDILDEVVINGVGVPASARAHTSVSSSAPVPQAGSPFLHPAPVVEPAPAPASRPEPTPVSQPEPIVHSPFQGQGAAPQSVSFQSVDPAIHFEKTQPAPVAPEEPIQSFVPQADAISSLTESQPLSQEPDFLAQNTDPELHQKVADFEGLPTRPPESPRFSPKILSLVVFVLILVLIAGGSWYYLSTRQEVTTTTPEQSINDIQAAASEVSKDDLNVTPPQYLAIDVETATPDSLRASLKAAGQKMIQDGVTTPQELLVTDTNSNPIAFSRFIVLFGGDAKSALAVGAGESFSLYLFVDGGKVRTALATSIKPEYSDSLVAHPADVLTSVKTIFFETPLVYAVTDKQEFSSSQYDGTAIQYTNIDATQGFSFDMAHVESSLVMANSKNTLRAVLDSRKNSSK